MFQQILRRDLVLFIHFYCCLRFSSRHICLADWMGHILHGNHCGCRLLCVTQDGGKNMIKNEIPQGAQKTTGAYNSEIVELQSTVTRLENQIKDLLKARDEIEKGNHDSLKARQDRLDSVIVEQHKIKDIITTGTLELQKKVDAHESDKKAHNDAVIAHETAYKQRAQRQRTLHIKPSKKR